METACVLAQGPRQATDLDHSQRLPCGKPAGMVHGLQDGLGQQRNSPVGPAFHGRLQFHHIVVAALGHDQIGARDARLDHHRPIVRVEDIGQCLRMRSPSGVRHLMFAF
jgi:hypothetical protein